MTPAPSTDHPAPLHSVVIRKATVHDADAIVTCLAAAFEAYREHYTPAAFSDTVLTHDSVRERLSTMCLFVAVAAGHVVGTVGCQVLDQGEGHLRGMGVLPEWQ